MNSIAAGSNSTMRASSTRSRASGARWRAPDALVRASLRCAGIALYAVLITSVQAAEPSTQPVVPPISKPAARAAAKTGAAATAKTNDRAVDHLQLDSTSITGNRELPKVMSIVPWKGAEPPAGPDRPMGSLIDELLAPLDRDEFRREVTYYHDLASPIPSAAPNVNVPGVSQP